MNRPSSTPTRIFPRHKASKRPVRFGPSRDRNGRLLASTGDENEREDRRRRSYSKRATFKMLHALTNVQHFNCCTFRVSFVSAFPGADRITAKLDATIATAR